MKKITVLFCFFSLLLLQGCYVIKQGVYQMKLLAQAEPIEKALRSPKLEAAPRAKLMLIQDIRRFSQQDLKLVVNKNYKNVNLDWNAKMYNISASMPLEFTPYLWWFPVIGHVPYKGFFEEDDAEKEAVRLQKEGLDTLISGVGGYSTLGYFSDPVWPSMLHYSDDHLAELIIHELAHSTVYFPNQTVFNESFANFVGKKGAELFFVQKYGKDSDHLKKMAQQSEYSSIQNHFFSDLHDELEENYQSTIDSDEKLAKKNAILELFKEKYATLSIPKSLKTIDWNRVNNAYLLSFKRYNYDEKIFLDLFTQLAGNFAEFLAFVKYHGDASNPFLSLRNAMEKAMIKS